METQHVLSTISSSSQSTFSSIASPSSLLDHLFSAFKMRFQAIFSVAPLITTSLAVNLYAAQYSGVISSLSLTQSGSNYTLALTSQNPGSAPQPSWLEKHPSNDQLIFAVDENWSGPNGTIAAYTKAATGILTQVDEKSTAAGPVSEAFYASGSAVAIANYAGSSVQTFTLDKTSGALKLSQTFTYTLSRPGPNPGRQDRPHPHQVLLDPSGGYIVAPDLGADLLRVYSVNTRTLQLKEEPAVAVTPGSGPRHGAFLKTSRGITYYFLVTELFNEVIVYRLSYGSGYTKYLSFQEVFRAGHFGPNPVPTGSSAAEVLVSVSYTSLPQPFHPCTSILMIKPQPDKRFLVTSSRNNNGTAGPDTLQTWTIDQSTGALTFKQLHTAGGLTPRHFSLNKAGTLVAVGLQGTGAVVIYAREVSTGLIGAEVARLGGLLGVNTVIWDE